MRSKREREIGQKREREEYNGEQTEDDEGEEEENEQFRNTNPGSAIPAARQPRATKSVARFRLPFGPRNFRPSGRSTPPGNAQSFMGERTACRFHMQCWFLQFRVLAWDLSTVCPAVCVCRVMRGLNKGEFVNCYEFLANTVAGEFVFLTVHLKFYFML